MASWHDMTLGAQLAKCPVCLCHVANKKLVKHTQDCYKNREAQMDEMGIIQCPFNDEHILPRIFLNHHLDGNCSNAMNLLRKFYQKEGMLRNFHGAPPDYDPQISKEYLNDHNRDLLYLLNEDMYGQFIRDYEKRTSQEQQQPETESPQ